MHLKTIFNHVTNYKPFVVDQVKMADNSIELSMRARGNGLPTCSGCSQRCPGYDSQPNPRRFDFVPLWIGPDRTAKTLLQFFRFIGKERCARVQFVCSDMWQAYVKVIAKKVPQAIHILDRFHVMHSMTSASIIALRISRSSLRNNTPCGNRIAQWPVLGCML